MEIYKVAPQSAPQTQNICITFVQRRPNVFDVGPPLYKSYTNVCAYWDVPAQKMYFLYVMYIAICVLLSLALMICKICLITRACPFRRYIGILP